MQAGTPTNGGAGGQAGAASSLFNLSDTSASNFSGTTNATGGTGGIGGNGASGSTVIYFGGPPGTNGAGGGGGTYGSGGTAASGGTVGPVGQAGKAGAGGNASSTLGVNDTLATAVNASTSATGGVGGQGGYKNGLSGASGTAKPRDRIAVLPALTSPHPFVRQALEQLAAAKAGSDNIVQSDPRTAVDVSVRSEVVDRALRVWDAFAKTWEKEGGQILAATFLGRPGTAAAIGDDHVRVHMAETYEPTRGRRSAEASGSSQPRLCFIIGEGQLNGIKGTWADTKTIALEKTVRPLIDAIRRYLEAQRQIRLDKECEHRQEEKALAIRRARANEIKDEFYLRHQIVEDVDRWEQAQGIRNFLAAMERRIADGAIAPKNEEGFRAWMEWAHWFADDMDPLVTAPARQIQPIVPKKTPIAELDLTSRARALVTQLNVMDTDELLLVPEDDVRKMSGWTSGMWRELTLVLEGLGYEVSRRKSSYYW